jgi:hypothetical protein
LLKPESERGQTVMVNFGKAYVNGNMVEGDDLVTKDNWDRGVQIDERSRAPVAEVLSRIRTNAPFPHAPLPIQPAREAYKTVLADAGATLPKRDAVDKRIIHAVRTGHASAKAPADIEAQLGGVGYSKEAIRSIIDLIPLGIITRPSQVGGYPKYQGVPYTDSDNDGMPDGWERKHGLNPKDLSDASTDLDGDGYTNIEDLINGTDPNGNH